MNPELRRNLWLELTTHRLLAMPAVLLLVFGVIAGNTGPEWAANVYSTALGLLMLLVIFWGSRQASESVAEEVRSRTWDWQRLSSLTPWQVAWGKLWGATAFSWYGGIFCVAAILVTARSLPASRQVGWTLLAVFGAGLALQGAALAASLQAARKDSKLGQRMGTLVFLPALVVASVVFMRYDGAHFHGFTWFGATRDTIAFVALSALSFAGWGMLAAHREMSRELKMGRLPWAFPAFVVFLAIYISGFGDFQSGGMRSAFTFAGLIVSLVLTYYAIFAEHTTAMRLRRLVVHARAGRWRRALEDLPLWATALATAVVFAIAAAAFPHGFDASVPGKWIGGYPVAAVLFAARDLGILVFFALGARARRVEAATLLYLVLLWYVIPIFLAGVGLDAVAQLFQPFGQGGWAATGLGVAHAAIAWAAVGWRWRKANRALDAI